jgi:DNA-binding transcriptional regulator YdaS (Cro superfamily)
MDKKISEHRKKLAAAFNGVDIADLAGKLGSTPSVVYNIKYGKLLSPKRAIVIEKLTNGQINRRLLRPDIFCD